MAKSKRDDEPTRDPADFARECLDALEAAGGGGWSFKDVKDRPGVGDLVRSDDATKIAAVREAVDRRARVAEAYRDETGDWTVSEALSLQNRDGYPAASLVLANHLLRRDLPFDDCDFVFLFERTACVPRVFEGNTKYLGNLRKRFAAFCEQRVPSAELFAAVERLVTALEAIVNASQRKAARGFRELLEAAPQPGENGSDEGDSDERTAFARRVLDELEAAHPGVHWFDAVKDSSVVGEILSANRERQAAVVMEAIDRRGTFAERLRSERGGEMPPMEAFHLHHAEGYPAVSVTIADRLLRRKLPLGDAELAFLVRRTACVPMVASLSTDYLKILVKKVEAQAAEESMSDGLRAAVKSLAASLASVPDPDDQRLHGRVSTLLHGTVDPPLKPGEVWSDAALADIGSFDASLRTAWVKLLEHAQAVSGGKPTAKWLKTAGPLLDAVGHDRFAEHVVRWFPLVNEPRTGGLPGRAANELVGFDLWIVEPHADILKGLAWCCSQVSDGDVARALTGLAITSYKKIPGVGPRLLKVGNAAVWALGAMPGLDAVGQLALLKVKVKLRTAQKGIEKGLAAAAEREGVTAEELEEMAVPTYGLTDVGSLNGSLGEYTAELRVTGTRSTTLTWIKPDGKPQKSVPAAVKRDFPEELKELKAAAKDVQKMLPAQAERIDNLFLAQRSWPFDVWRERYLDHPLVGTIAQRLVWEFTADDRSKAAIWSDGNLVDSDGIPIDEPSGSTVRLWHPIDRDVDEIVVWRERLARFEVRQPFKQAHREVYLLTDAERNTGVYSNRFAAHIVRQHQFHALCQARGWRNGLRLMVDDDFPPASKELPEWGLRAEFWVEGAGDEYGRDTNETGTYLHLATDQVRFYPIDAAQLTAHASGGGYRRDWINADTGEPIPLEEIPPLVLSEVLRDVDLFVGVASVGNDPTWQDGGPDGRYRDYWESFSFGDLGESAHTRKAVLERLVPRLKIADRCSFSDRFLVVRGDVRTYKIHLGSGNILMEPNDQYLCIVPRSDTAGDKLFLPFDGDRTLSLILSKALMLAADTKIEDPTIISQIA